MEVWNSSQFIAKLETAFSALQTMFHGVRALERWPSLLMKPTLQCQASTTFPIAFEAEVEIAASRRMERRHPA